MAIHSVHLRVEGGCCMELRKLACSRRNTYFRCRVTYWELISLGLRVQTDFNGNSLYSTADGNKLQQLLLSTSKVKSTSQVKNHAAFLSADLLAGENGFWKVSHNFCVSWNSFFLMRKLNFSRIKDFLCNKNNYNFFSSASHHWALKY